MTTATQNERILWKLKERGYRGMCSLEPIRWSPPILRTAGRITDLKRLGHIIEAPYCTENDHGAATGVKRYRLITDDQGRLL